MRVTIKFPKIYFLLLCLTIILVCCKPKERPTEENPSPSEWYFSSFTKVDSLNPILVPSPELRFEDPITHKNIAWESRNVLNPTALVKDGKVYLFYRAQDSTGTSRIGLATSEDGLHFNKQATPVFFPDEDDQKRREWNYMKFPDYRGPKQDCATCFFDGVEDPRIIQSPDGTYIMTYTAYDGQTARLSIASSSDLQHWDKKGSVFDSEKYSTIWSKSGAIVVEEIEGKNIAKKINGKYHMYFGDTQLFYATSDDLITWTVIENEENQKAISVLNPRPGYFDSRLVEPGPFGLATEKGILLIYNSSNAANVNDPNLPKFTYSAGQALYDNNEPFKILDRTSSYFIYPDKSYEKEGEVNEVCFVEGLVHFKNKWFLYYGTGDSKIAVAVHEE